MLILHKVRESVRDVTGRSSEAIRPELKSFYFSATLDFDITCRKIRSFLRAADGTLESFSTGAFQNEVILF